MLRTVHFTCSLPKADADALNAESGRIYTDMVVRHYRLYRKQGVWLAPRSGERLEDILGGPTTLHAHSRDAAQQGFYKACKTARACRDAGMDVKYPYKRKRWRTTIWKAAASGIAVTLVEEAYTSQTCPGLLRDGTSCLQCYKPRGRLYRCPACGFDSTSRRRRLCQSVEPALHRGAWACAATQGKVSSPVRGQA